MRIAITGGPRTGKTTLAREMADRLGMELVSTDDYIELGWSEASARVAEILAQGAPRIVEGVAVPRALRKLLEAQPDVKPIDRLVILAAPRIERTAGQETMARGVDTVLDEILPVLEDLGVTIERR